MNLQSKYRANVFNHVFDSIIITDNQGIIIDWNIASEKLFGHTKASAVGQSIALVHVPEDSQKITLAVISAVSKTGEWNGQVRSFHKNGTIGKIQSKCVAIYDENHEMIGTIGINRDITHC